MLLYSRRRALLSGVALVALSACDMVPIYHPEGAAAQLRGAVLLRAPTNRVEFEFLRNVERRIGAPTSAVYTLEYDITLKEEKVIISNTQETQRLNIIGTLAYTLKDDAENTVATGQVSSFTGYASTGTVIATASAQRDAENRLIRLLSDQLLDSINAQILK